MSVSIAARTRYLLAAAAAVPAIVAVFIGPLAPTFIERDWWPPALAAALALGLLLALRRNYVLILVAAGLAGLAARSAGEGRLMLSLAAQADAEDSFAAFDLAEEGLPDPPPTFATVHGYFRDGWTLDEYAVARGKLPDQSSTPGAILVPFVGSTDDTVHLAERQGISIVVARVAPNTVTPHGQRTTIRGRVSPLDDHVLATLVTIQGAPEDARGVLVDTLAVPTRRDAWVELGLAFIALLTACAAVYFAAAPRPEPA